MTDLCVTIAVCDDQLCMCLLASTQSQLVHDGDDAAAQEANAINKSLTFLEQTVNALSRKEGHVPFRQSKLTSLLRDALGGNCKTV